MPRCPGLRCHFDRGLRGPGGRRGGRVPEDEAVQARRGVHCLGLGIPGEPTDINPGWNSRLLHAHSLLHFLADAAVWLAHDAGRRLLARRQVPDEGHGGHEQDTPNALRFSSFISTLRISYTHIAHSKILLTISLRSNNKIC